MRVCAKYHTEGNISSIITVLKNNEIRNIEFVRHAQDKK